MARSVGSATTAASAVQSFTAASAPRLAYSSSATMATMTRPRRPAVDAASRRAAPRIAATPPFMSCAPRPKSLPSRRTGSKGAAMPSTPTVSLCPQSMRAGPPRAPSMTPKTFGRPGAAGATRTSSAEARISAAIRSAIAPSPAPPGTSEGFTESIATRSRSSSIVGSLMAGMLRSTRPRANPCPRYGQTVEIILTVSTSMR